MTDRPDPPENWLLTVRLRSLAAAIAAAPDDPARERLWAEADAALRTAGASEDADVALPVMERDLGEVRKVLAAWEAGTLPLPAWDKAVLHRAMNAYKKRLKLARLDEESTAGVNPLSAGRRSSIVGIRPPGPYEPEVWALLVRQGRLRDAGDGVYEPLQP